MASIVGFVITRGADAPRKGISQIRRAAAWAVTMRLPERYQTGFAARFDALVQESLRPEIRILDVGSGRRPTIAPSGRPPNCTYVGLDVSKSELEMAPEGAYDQTIVSDVSQPVADLMDSFDLAISFQVLEHVVDVDAALANLHAYLRPGGRLITQFSGKFSAFALPNIVLPRRISLWALENLHGREPGASFTAYYDRCWYSALQHSFAEWSRYEITARFVGAQYFKFLPPLQAIYLIYENYVYTHQRLNLATHYLVDATK